MLNEARKIETRFKTEYSKSIIQNRYSISHFLFFFSAQYMPKSKQINQCSPPRQPAAHPLWQAAGARGSQG